MKVEFYRHSLSEEDRQSVLECLNGLFLTTGSYVAQFEQRFAAYLGTGHAIGLTSCTAALHLALLALGIHEGDEVITTPMTFIATATAIIHTGATPVFVDVEADTGLIDPAAVDAAITERTRAIIPVHLYGHMCDMKALHDIASRSNLRIIEDAAHCIEGERDGVRPGQLSDAACFSFYATKNITSGEGGALTTNDAEIARTVRLLRQHGMSTEASDRWREGYYRHWDMLACGWKYNMDNIQASLLLPQMRRIEAHWQERSHLYDYYHQRLGRIDGLAMPAIRPGTKNAFHLFTVWLPAEQRDSLIEFMNREGIGLAVNYRAIHLLSWFRDRYAFRRGMFPNAERIGSRTVSLPFYPRLSAEEMAYVCDVLERGLGQ